MRTLVVRIVTSCKWRCQSGTETIANKRHDLDPSLPHNGEQPVVTDRSRPTLVASQNQPVVVGCSVQALRAARPGRALAEVQAQPVPPAQAAWHQTAPWAPAWTAMQVQTRQKAAAVVAVALAERVAVSVVAVSAPSSVAHHHSDYPPPAQSSSPASLRLGVVGCARCAA